MPRSALSDSHDDFPALGRLEGTSVPELLHELAGRQYSGSLVLEHEGVEKVAFWRDGRIVFAASSDPEDRLGVLLLRRGQVSLAHLVDAAGRVEPGRRLGHVLVGSGTLDGDAVVRAVVDQVREIVLSVFPWRTGAWRTTRTQLTSESVTLEDSVPELIRAGVRRVHDWPWIRRAVGGPRAAYRARPRDGGWPTMGLLERSVLRVLETPRRVQDVCGQVYAPAYEVYRCLWALGILGVIERAEAGAQVEGDEAGRQGTLGDGGVPDILLRLGDERFTGVLRVYRGANEGAIYLHEGRVAFATTRDPEMSLLVHLLRRGVISDADHEAVLQRLITGKRIGTLLAERGALTSVDVERFVREQVTEVAIALVRQESGEYTVDPDLPSREPVTLDWSVEDLIVAALEGSSAVGGIWESLQGLESRYRLREEYLQRLDRMRLRTLAWEIVSSLREERTLSELLEERPEPDHDVCRMVYALERVRVVERVGDLPAERTREEGAFLASPAPEADDGAAGRGVTTGEWDAGEEPVAATDPDPVRPRERPRGIAADLAPELFGLPPDAEPAAESESPRAPEPAPEPEPVSTSIPIEVEPGAAVSVPVEEAGNHREPDAGEVEPGTKEDEAAGVEDGEPVPEAVREAVERFNRRHQVMFEELRREIGAGVRNYVHTCQRRIGEASELFSGLEPDRSGAFDARRLGQALVRYRARAAGPVDEDALLDLLIDKEILIVRDLLSGRRLEEIEQRLASVS